MPSPSFDAAWRDAAVAASEAVVQELTLWLNHLIASEPTAAERLRTHAGRHVRVSLGEGSLGLLDLNLAVTAAGLLEPVPTSSTPCLTVRPNGMLRDIALRLVNGERVPWAVEGDAGLAADVDWLVKNLRWDVRDDLARLLGPILAHELARSGAVARDLARGVLRMLAAVAPQGRNPPAAR